MEEERLDSTTNENEERGGEELLDIDITNENEEEGEEQDVDYNEIYVIFSRRSNVVVTEEERRQQSEREERMERERECNPILFPRIVATFNEILERPSSNSYSEQEQESFLDSFNDNILTIVSSSHVNMREHNENFLQYTQQEERQQERPPPATRWTRCIFEIFLRNILNLVSTININPIITTTLEQQQQSHSLLHQQQLYSFLNIIQTLMSNNNIVDENEVLNNHNNFNTQELLIIRICIAFLNLYTSLQRVAIDPQHFLNATFERLQAASEQDSGLSIEKIQELPTRELLSDDETNICYICHENYKKSNQLRILKCNHDFHINCIDYWLQQKSTCPICRISQK